MSDLRAKLIEAGANAVANDRAEEIEVWHFADAEVALDAFLDCLAENALEWFDAAGWTDNADDLIDALRESE